MPTPDKSPTELELKMRTARLELNSLETAFVNAKAALEAAKTALNETITAAAEEPSVFVTVDEAARLTATSRETIYRLVRAGRLKLYKFAAASRIRRLDIECLSPAAK